MEGNITLQKCPPDDTDWDDPPRGVIWTIDLDETHTDIRLSVIFLWHYYLRHNFDERSIMGKRIEEGDMPFNKTFFTLIDYSSI